MRAVFFALCDVFWTGSFRAVSNLGHCQWGQGSLPLADDNKPAWQLGRRSLSYNPGYHIHRQPHWPDILQNCEIYIYLYICDTYCCCPCTVILLLKTCNVCPLWYPFGTRLLCDLCSLNLYILTVAYWFVNILRYIISTVTSIHGLWKLWSSRLW